MTVRVIMTPYAKVSTYGTSLPHHRKTLWQTQVRLCSKYLLRTSLGILTTICIKRYHKIMNLFKLVSLYKTTFIEFSEYVRYRRVSWTNLLKFSLLSRRIYGFGCKKFKETKNVQNENFKFFLNSCYVKHTIILLLISLKVERYNGTKGFTLVLYVKVKSYPKWERHVP